MEQRALARAGVRRAVPEAKLHRDLVVGRVRVGVRVGVRVKVGVRVRVGVGVRVG